MRVLHYIFKNIFFSIHIVLRRLISCEVLSFYILLLVTIFATNMSQANNHLQSVLQGNGLFTKNLYGIFAKSEAGNIFFSPISIHAILSLAAQGSEGITKQALVKTLNVPSIEAAAEGYQHVMDKLNNIEDVALYMANKVYIKESYKLKQGFKTAVIKYFYSEIQSVDFSQSAAAAQTINTWVENKTNQKIKDLISEGDLDDDTRLVLVNAIYFKGRWAQEFDPKNTSTEKFYINNNESIDVQMMHLTKHFYFKEDEVLDAKVLEMPYTNKDVSMIILLPNKRDGIAELEQKLADVDLTKITENMYKQEVVVSLPKFKVETTMQLNEPLKEMGLSSIFDQTADLSGMLDSPDKLCVSKIVQKAFIEVNEEGAEAAAATGMAVRRVRSAVHRVTFTAEHPFVVSIGVNRSSLLFFGKVELPSMSQLLHDEL